MEEKIIEYSDEELVNEAISSTLKLYMLDVFKYPLLTREETYELGMKSKNGDEEARKTLIEHNLRLVLWVLKYLKIRIPRLNHIKDMDLIQEGNIGLIKAVNQFNPEKGALSTLAKEKIEQEIRRSILNKEPDIHKPIEVGREITNYLRFINDYKNKHGKNPDDFIIKSELNITGEMLNRIKDALRFKVVSINSKPYDDEENTSELIEYIEDENNEKERIFDYEYIITIKTLLTPREYYLIYQKYISYEQIGMSEISRRLSRKISRQTLEQIEKKAIKKLKALCINEKDKLERITGSIRLLEKQNFYKIKTSPIDIEKIILYSFIKDKFTEEEKYILDLELFSKYIYSKIYISKLLNTTVEKVEELYKRINQKFLLEASEYIKYQQYRESILQEYGITIFNVTCVEEIKLEKSQLKLIAN